MTTDKIIRAWKDEDFRNTLTESERTALPGNPAGIIDLTDADIAKASGAEDITFLIFCASTDIDCDSTTIVAGTCKMWTQGCCKKIAPSA
jgi:mersacidin/lichenicidin family type 2 lantibiotic